MHKAIVNYLQAERELQAAREKVANAKVLASETARPVGACESLQPRILWWALCFGTNVTRTGTMKTLGSCVSWKMYCSQTIFGKLLPPMTVVSTGLMGLWWKFHNLLYRR